MNQQPYLPPNQMPPNQMYNQVPPGYPPLDPYQRSLYRRPLRRWANIIGGGLLILNLLMLLLGAVFSAITQSLDYSGLGLGIMHLIDEMSSLTNYVLSFWIATVFMALLIKIPWNVAFPLKRPKLSIALPAMSMALGVSILGSMLTGWLSACLEVVFHVVPDMPEMPIPIGVGANVVYVISIVIAPAIFEEMMFRGVIMQALRRFGDGFALVVSAILFGLVHGNLIQGPNAILLGLVIGYFVLRTGSLWIGILIHFFNNGLAVLWSYLMENMTDQQMELLNLSVFAGYLFFGAIGLIFLINKSEGAIGLAPSSYPLTSGSKYCNFFFTVPVILFILFIVWITSLWMVPV